jgi:hypothetical protein
MPTKITIQRNSLTGLYRATVAKFGDDDPKTPRLTRVNDFNNSAEEGETWAVSVINRWAELERAGVELEDLEDLS